MKLAKHSPITEGLEQALKMESKKVQSKYNKFDKEAKDKAKQVYVIGKSDYAKGVTTPAGSKAWTDFISGIPVGGESFVEFWRTGWYEAHNAELRKQFPEMYK